MLIEEHIKLINTLHHCPCDCDVKDFANLNDITLYQARVGYDLNATEVIIDGRHYLVIGLFTAGEIDIIQSW